MEKRIKRMAPRKQVKQISEEPDIVESSADLDKFSIHPGRQSIDTTQVDSPNFEPILDLLSTLSEHLNFESFHESIGNFEKSLESSSSSFTTAQAIQIFYNLKAMTYCQACKDNHYSIVTACNHRFCSDCFYSLVSQQIENLEETAVVCPSCASPLTDSDLKAHPKIWYMLKECSECNSELKRSMILAKTCCFPCVCLLCQAEFSASECRKCMKSLDASSVSQVKSLVEKLPGIFSSNPSLF